MTPEEVAKLEPVGEFGSKAWCEACAAAGVKLLEAGDIPDDIAWAFTEDYTFPPARLMTDGREKSGYFIMVKNGEITGGDGVPEECIALSGFHARIPWAAICNQSRAKYGTEGQRQRSADEQVMYSEIAEYVGRENPLGLEPIDRVWPREVGAAIGKGHDEGAGLHNIAAAMQAPSPEFQDLPTTELGVPIFNAMTEDQKRFFLGLMNVTV